MLAPPVSQLAKSLTARQAKIIEKVITWGVPPVVIPTLRYMQDPPETRNKLYIRDVTTYSLGTLVFFGMELLMQKLLKRTRLPKSGPWLPLLAFLPAMAGNMLYAGWGAVKLSNWLAPKLEKPSTTESEKPKIAYPPTPSPVSRPSISYPPPAALPIHQPRYMSSSWSYSMGGPYGP